MRTYTIASTNGQPWRAYVGAFSFMGVTTSDRRAARKIVRLARRLGYSVSFTMSQHNPYMGHAAHLVHLPATVSR